MNKKVFFLIMILLSFSFVSAQDSDYPVVIIGGVSDDVYITVNESTNDIYNGNVTFYWWNLSDSGWLYNDSYELEWNETKGDARYQLEIGADCGAGDFVKGVDDDGVLDCDTPSVADTHVAGDDVYLTNDSSTMFFNESLLNATIDARGGTDSHVAGDDVYLYNDSSTMYFNETLINETIDARSINNTLSEEEVEDFVGGMVAGNTETNIAVTYEDGDGTLDFVITMLKDLVAGVGLTGGADDVFVGADSDVTINLNESWLNDTYLDDTDTWWTIDAGYLYNDSTTVYFNETLMNETISALDSDTHVAGDDVYLTNDSTTMSFNESLLNITIDARSINNTLTEEEVEDFVGGMATNGDGVDFTYVDGGVGSGTLTPSFDCSDVVGAGLICSGEDVAVNETWLNATYLDDTDTHVAGDGLYLTNDSSTMFFNETLLNVTIDTRSTNGTDSHVAGDGNYLYNDSSTMFFNDTLLNETHLPLAGGVITGNVTFADNIYLIFGNDSDAQIGWNGTHLVEKIN